MSDRGRFDPAEVVADRVEEDAEVSRLVDELEAQADRDADAERITVSFRWGKGQLALVKRAASLAGVPYQTYLKLVVFRQAAEDLARAARGTAGDEGPRPIGRRA
jgi:predicted DNA binding CopG/RHH family protein